MAFRLVSFLSLCLATGGFCLAQTTTTGLISGLVLDPEGKPVAGARIRLESRQIERGSSTGSGGRFQAGLLNPGEWTITVGAEGFQTLATRVLVAPGATLPVRFRLAPLAAATVQVRDAGAVASLVPTSTFLGASLTGEDIARLPVGRSINDLIYLAPLTGFAGKPWNGAVGLDYSISGASGIENQFLADGLVTTDLRYGGQGLFLVPEFVASVQVETAGFQPENSALGGVFNAVIRSGGNEFRGDAWATFSPAALEAGAKSNAAGFRQPAPADRADFGFAAGGALVKDRLFYFAGLDLDGRRDRTEPNLSGLRGDDKDTGTLQTVVKVNGFLTPGQQLTATWIATRLAESQPRAYPDGYGDADWGYHRTYRTHHFSLVYDRSWGDSVLLSLKAGTSWRKDDWRPESPDAPAIQDDHWFSGGGGGDRPDLATYSYFRGGRGGYGFESSSTTQFKADLTWFLGRHALKGGLSHIAARYGRQDLSTGPAGDNWGYTISLDGSQIEAMRSGSLQGAEVNARYQALYLQDTWELGRRVRLTYGLRAERQVLEDAAGETRLSFTDLGRYLQPRLGLTWDVAGDGRTQVSFSYAAYYEQVPMRLAIRAWGNETTNVRDYALTAYSPKGLGAFDPGAPTGGWNWEPNTLLVAPGTRLPKRRELTLGFEKALPMALTGSLRTVYRHLTDGMDDSGLYDKDGQPVLRTAAGNLIGILWNPSRSVTFVAPAGAIDRDGNPIGGRTLTVADTLFPEAWNKYWAITLGLGQRTERTFWNATYTWSHLWGNFEGLAQPDRGAGVTPDANIGQGFDAWPYVGTGNLGLDRRHSFKVSGSHRFAWPAFALNLGGAWTWQSGLALSLQDDGSTTLGLPPGTLGVGNPLDPMGGGAFTYDHGLAGNHGRSPTTSVLDLHADLAFRAGRVRWAPALDVFNLLNARTATLIYQYASKWWTGEPDRRYGQEQAWLQGRRVQLGVKARF